MDFRLKKPLKINHSRQSKINHPLLREKGKSEIVIPNEWHMIGEKGYPLARQQYRSTRAGIL